MFGLKKRIKALEDALDAACGIKPLSEEAVCWNLRFEIDSIARRIPEQSRDTVTTSAEPKVTFFVADTLAELIQRICLLEKQIPAFLPACVADLDKRVEKLERCSSEMDGVELQSHIWGMEADLKLQRKQIEAMEDGTAPGIHSRIADLSDSMQSFEQSTAATLHQYADAVLTFRDDLTLLMEHLRLKFTMTPEVPAVPAQPSRRIVVSVETKKTR
jgi:hypothetical protein